MSALILISVLAVVLLYLGFGNNRSLLAPVAIVGLLGVLLALFLRYQQQLMRWIDRSVHRQIQNERDPGKITETITTETITDV